MRAPIHYVLFFVIGVLLWHMTPAQSQSQSIDERSTRERLTVVEEKMTQIESRMSAIDQKLEKMATDRTSKLYSWRCNAYVGEHHKQSDGVIYFVYQGTPYSGFGQTAQQALDALVANIYSIEHGLRYAYADTQGMTGLSIATACHAVD